MAVVRRLAAALVLASALALSPRAVHADVADYLGKPIVAVDVDAEGRRLSDPAVAGLIQTAVGSPLTMADVRATMAHLFALGRFADVVVYANAVSGGVAIRYELVPVHPIARMLFTGLPPASGIDAGTIRRVVVERFGASPPASRATEIGTFVTAELRNRGFRRARVTTRVDVEHAPERGTLVFVVAPGTRARIERIDVTSTSAMPEAEVRRTLGVSDGSTFQPLMVSERTQRIVDDLKRRGFYNARVTVTPRFAEDESSVTLAVAVVPGPHVRLEFAGDALPTDRRDELVPIRREGAVDEDLLEDSAQRIEEFLRGQGYRDATATFTRETQGDDLVIRFTVVRGPQYRVAHIDVTGNASVSTVDLAPALRVREGQVFSAAALSAQVAAIQDIYARRGYAAARAVPEARAGTSADAQQVPVSIAIVITENVRTVVSSVRFEGNRTLAPAALSEGLGLLPGQPFYATQLALDQDAVQLKYANAGFRTATVSAAPGLSADGARADIVFTVEEGPQVFVEHVLIVGNQRTSTDTIRRELQFKSGDPLGLAAVSESQRRLATLGLFRRTRISELGHGAETERDVLISIEEAPVTTLGYGGGLETKPVIRGTDVASEQLEFAPRAFFEVGRRNLFGKNRSVNFFTRVSFRPQGFSGETAGVSAGTYGFSEYRVIGTYREPRVRGTAADAFLTGTLEQQRRSSFNFARRALSAELLRRLTRQITVTGNYQLQRTELFDERIKESERLLVDRLFPQVRLSSFSLSGIRDSRDDLIDPRAGTYLSANGQVAGRHIGSEVGYVKSYFTAQLFRTVPQVRRVVVASSLRVGLASGFAREVRHVDANGLVTTEIVRDLPASERFFAGGDTTVRGFALDQLGTDETIGTGGFAIGGNALMIVNAELRVPVRGGLGLVGFFDAGNVFKQSSAIDLGELRSALGFGVRYKSPVGPIRVDVGFKTQRRELGSGRREDPLAVHISLGQAF